MSWGELGFAATLLLAVGNLPCTKAWRTSGVLPLQTDFVQYVGKFCFDSSKTNEAGLFKFTIEGLVQEGQLPPGAPPPEVKPAAPCWGPCDPTGGLYLVVYDDEKPHWRTARKEWQTLTCKERLQDASWARRISPLPPNGVLNRTVYVSEKIRPRFWYFSFVACDVAAIQKPIQYHIHAENILMDWQHEFGVDQEGDFTLQVFFTTIFIGFACVLRGSTAVPGRSESFRARPLLRLLLFSVLFSAAGCIFLTFHYGFYIMDGYGMPWMEVVGMLLACVSKACLNVLQILTAKGWVLFYSPNEIAWRRFTVCIIGSMIILSAACEIHGQYSHDWRTTLYLYESGPGILILLLNVVLFIEASRSMWHTYSNEASQEVREFYRTIAGAIGVYYLTLPLICLLAGAFSPWVRRKYVMRAEILARFLAMALLTYCLRPSRLDIIINSRLEDGLDSDMCDSADEMEECLDYADREVNRPLTEGMERSSVLEADTE